MVAECDPTRIEQVITNLVSNAVKYSPCGGRVTVSAFAERSEAIVSVSDEGMGIPPEDRERIFEPFRRTRSSRLVPGVGLGLSVARKIVAGHGGTLEVESRVGARIHVSRQAAACLGSTYRRGPTRCAHLTHWHRKTDGGARHGRPVRSGGLGSRCVARLAFSSSSPGAWLLKRQIASESAVD